MISRQELGAYLQQLLNCEAFNDYAPNGLQVEGVAEIKNIVTAVTASQDVIDKAVAMKADALLVHHGFFWRGEDPLVIGMKRQRLGALLSNNLNLFAYHLPLDCHLEFGNNACLAARFEVQEVLSHRVNNTNDLLWTGQFKEGKTAESLLTFLEGIFERRPLHLAAEDKLIKQIAWCSGGAQDFITQAQALGVDAYISGEVSERTFYQAQELGLHYFACGHHATERYGIQALGQHLAERFGLEHRFIDSWNPV